MAAPSLIEIEWDGPLALSEVATLQGGSDYGIYQVYGTHHVFGADSLLYIGRAKRRPFATRIPEHLHWIEWEAHPVSIYIGRLGGLAAIDDEEWEKLIVRAERLLLYFCAPPYNSSGLVQLAAMPPTIVLNLRRKHRIPPELSTYLETTDMTRPEWKLFGSE